MKKRPAAFPDLRGFEYSARVIHLDQVTIQSGSFSLENVSFTIPSQQYGVLMGRTGSGKTTILEAICGLRSVQSGTISLMGRDVTRALPSQRGVGYVPQDGALFSTMTVEGNLEFPLGVHKWKRDARRQRVEELADLLGITALLKRRVLRLSGGEAQRVALGRALSFRPNVLVLDEPLSALDTDTRLQMYELLERVQQHESVTVLHVTHSYDEADRLHDCVLRVEDGRVEDVTTSRRDSAVPGTRNAGTQIPGTQIPGAQNPGTQMPGTPT